MQNQPRKITWEINAHGCWVCTSHARQTKGYAFSNSRAYGKQCLHRYMYEQANGMIPAGLLLRHICDNPGCINPNHLVLGTHQENMNDKTNRGRTSKTSGKRTRPDWVLEIYRDRTRTAKELSMKYGLSIDQIYAIWSGRAWKNLTEIFVKDDEVRRR